MCGQGNFICNQDPNNQEESSSRSMLFEKMSKIHESTNDLHHLVPSTTERCSKDKAQFSCPIPGCNKVFSRKLRLSYHMKEHCGVQPHKCSFPGCGKSFNEKSNLKIHMRIHSNSKPFKCAFECGKTFRTKANCIDHERRHLAYK